MRKAIVVVVAVLVVTGVVGALACRHFLGDAYETETLDRLPEEPFDELADDPEPAAPPFVADRVDPRPVGKDGGWRVNLSAATFRLDVAEGNDEDDASLVELHASYADAARGRENVLPSIDAIDGKAKRF